MSSVLLGIVKAQVLADLQRVRLRLAPPDSWCQHKYFRTVGAQHQCCLTGAFNQEGVPFNSKAFNLVEEAVARRYRRGVIYFNDAATTTHADILSVLDEAINQARQL